MNSEAEFFVHAAIGIAGEAGEVLDSVKKHWVYNAPLDQENLVEELGDVLFYVQAMALKLGVSLEQVVSQNMAKLMKRYPTGYSDHAAVLRADKSDFK